MPKLEPIATLSGRSASRRARAMRVSTSLAEINVVPLVDVMLVLLVIFMVAAPMMQQGFTVQLPKAQQAQPVKTEPVTVTIPSTFRRDHKVGIGNDIVDIKFLPERLRQAFEGHLKHDVVIAGDGRITYDDLIAVMDVLKAAKTDNLTLKMQPAGSSLP